nr:heme ABC exporter ATP-binding protein CcmA [Luteithermobacter gelatinilyticus]
MLTAEQLTVIRGETVVFSGLSFALAPGQALILRGPNGSGKSSLLKSLAGILPVAIGEIRYQGESLAGERDWIARNICYLAHKNGLKPELTVGENLVFWRHVHGDRGLAVKDALAALGIAHLEDQPARYLSSGQARRTALARILCQPGRIWLLDEPTVGLDRSGVERLAGLMNRHLAEGGMIMAATHMDLGLEPGYVSQLDLESYSRLVPGRQDAPLSGNIAAGATERAGA